MTPKKFIQEGITRREVLDGSFEEQVVELHERDADWMLRAIDERARSVRAAALKQIEAVYDQIARRLAKAMPLSEGALKKRFDKTTELEKSCGREKRLLEYADDVIERVASARAALANGNANAAVIDALRAAESLRACSIKGLELDVVASIVGKKRPKAGGDATQKKYGPARLERNQQIERYASYVLHTGRATLRSVAKVIADDGRFSTVPTEDHPDTRALTQATISEILRPWKQKQMRKR